MPKRRMAILPQLYRHNPRQAGKASMKIALKFDKMGLT
jgi:hypothetical protein